MSLRHTADRENRHKKNPESKLNVYAKRRAFA